MEPVSSRFTERYKTAGVTVEAVRVKQARRRSASQKENRDRVLRKSRRFEPLLPVTAEQEGEAKLGPQESSMTAAPIQNSRMEMLRRYKEDKLLRKLKAEREKPKHIFKVGIYRPGGIPFLDLKPQSQNTVKPKAKAILASTSDLRVTRSMSKKLEPFVTKAPRFTAPAKLQVGPVKNNVATNQGGSKVVSVGTRSQHQAIQSTAPKVPAAREKRAVQVAPVKPPQTRGRAEPKTAPKAPGPVQVTKHQMAISKTRKPGKSGEKSNCKPVAVDELKSVPCGEQEMEVVPEKEVQPLSSEELILPTERDDGHQMPFSKPVLDVDRMSKKVSFAPENYVFAPVAGLDQFKFTPLSPRSVEGFFAPHSWSPIKHKSKSNFGYSASVNSVIGTGRNKFAPEIESKSLPEAKSEDHVTTVVEEVPMLNKPQDSFASSTADVKGQVHDVAYFRGVVVSETENLTGLCQQWEGWANSSEVPDGVKDLVRTTVGQARLLMGERFKQFNGLVNNCEFKTSEKEVTCTDLEGFWDMVYFQVTDVNKKFERLKKLQENSWEEQNELPSLPKKVVKKKVAIPKPTEGLVIKANKTPVAPRSRFAALKAAMKAKLKQEMAGSSSKETRKDEVIVFDAGFFRVESPAKSFPASPKICSTIGRASSQQPKEQCPTTKSSVCNSANPTSPVPCMAVSPSQQTSDSHNILPETQSPIIMMKSFISSMAGESTAQEAACSGKSTEEISTSLEFSKYLRPRSCVGDLPEVLQPPFHDNENDAKSICTKRSSTRDFGLSELSSSPLNFEDVEMKSPASQRTSPTGAHPISQEEMLPLANCPGLLIPNSISTTPETPSFSSVDDLLVTGITLHSVSTGNYMSPFETMIREDHRPALPLQVALQDLMSFSPSGTPQ
ncbi:disks large-associated protein 5 isoform X2 [Heptranchias perlo]|uniref:disks large-associated protein 5 isoform X2 n=1 Tax=Heptranchias perlo TaxID=212740 RepID=UPI00355A5548